MHFIIFFAKQKGVKFQWRKGRFSLIKFQMEEKRKIIFHRIFEWKKSGKKCPKWGVLGCFWPFLSVFVSHETQPPRRIVPRGTYIFTPFFTLSGVFHMKRRFYYIFAIFNEILVSCETSVLCGFVAFHHQIGRLSGLFSSKMACETIYPP